MIEQKKHQYEYAVLVGIINQAQTAQQVSDYMDELAFLTLTAGGEVLKRFTQKLDTPHPKTFIGSGKMEDVYAYVKAHDISTVIFDDELTPAQQANIEELLKCKILDRTGLILDNFCTACQNELCSHTSRTGAISIFTATPKRTLDTLGASAWRNWYARTRRNRN